MRNLIVGATVLLAPSLALGQDPQALRCALEPEAGSVFSGTCAEPDGAITSIRLTRVETRDPFTWQGSWGVPSEPQEWVAIAVAPPSEAFHASGVVETYWGGWFSLLSFERSDAFLRFSFIWDGDTGPPPLDADLRIVERAVEILGVASAWDRNDDRVCLEADTTWSLYCALTQATREEVGLPHHDQTAMRVVRGVVVESYPDRIQTHALMDFNNHPRTTLGDLHDLLSRSAGAIRLMLEDPSHWPPTGALYRIN